jgi:hypothetical protein
LEGSCCGLIPLFSSLLCSNALCLTRSQETSACIDQSSVQLIWYVLFSFIC